jgi:hypothetical protein
MTPSIALQQNSRVVILITLPDDGDGAGVKHGFQGTDCHGLILYSSLSHCLPKSLSDQRESSGQAASKQVSINSKD